MSDRNYRKTKYNPKDFDTFSEEQKIFIKRLYTCLNNLGEVAVSSDALSYDKVRDCVLYVKDTYPEFFYFDWWSYRDSGKGWEIFPEYRYSYSEVLSRRSQIAKQAAEIIHLTEKAKTSYDRCGIIHNYIVRNCVYDDEAKGHSEDYPEAYTIEGFFFHRKAVCQGIALTFKYLCDMLGINTMVVSGRSFKPGEKRYTPHAWNIVRSGPYAAQLDVTWDMCLYDKSMGMRYDYFFLSDLEMLRDHQYVGYPDCEQLKNNYFEITGTQFESAGALDRYIEKQIQNGSTDQTVLLHFKVKNIKMTFDEVEDHIRNVLRKTITSGYSSLYSLNKSQGVYTYKIETKGGI